MTIVTIYDKKSEKIVTEDYIEIDLSDLELYGNFRHATDFVKFPSHKIDGKTIMEWFESDDISYWWLAASILHPKYNEAVLFINRLSLFIDTNSIKLIKLHGAFDKTVLIKQLVEQKKIKLEISRNYYSFLITNRIKKFAKKSVYQNIMKEKIKKRVKLFNQIKNFQKPEVGSIIITSPDVYRRETFDFETNKPKNEESFIKPFLDVLSENKKPIICFDLDYTLRGTTDTLKERLGTNFNWLPIEIILSHSKSSRVKKSIATLKKSINLLLKKRIDNLLIYKNISLSDYLKQSFEDLFLEPNLPTYLHLTETLEDYLRKIKPKAIIQVYETGTYAKTFEIVAKKLGIKTIGIQHGLIPTDYPDYTFKEIRSDAYPLGNLIPNLTLVYGNYYKKILTEIGAYPTDKVQVIGNPIYYDFDKTIKLLDRKKILIKNNLPDKKIVLIPLSYRFFYFENSQDRTLVNILFKEIKDRDDIIVLVRLHPGEKFDQEMFTRIFPSNNFKISTTTLFEDIFVSDVVVVLPISSVCTEVPLFEKPLILVNLQKNQSLKSIEHTYLQLVEQEVAKLVSIEDLIQTVNSLKKGELWKIAESSKRKEFLKDFFNYDKSIDLLKLIYE